jgi:hypothetical protein
MQNLSSPRVLGAAVLASLGALLLFTSAFATIDRVRVKLVETPVPAVAGTASVPTAGFDDVKALRPPFALIARSSGASAVTIALDGVPVCQRAVSSGNSQRVDCVVTGEWNPAVDHTVAIHGPTTPWTLDYLELATHHGNTGIHSAHYLVILPVASDHYVRPGLVWLLGTWLGVFAALLLLPAVPPMPRWLRYVYTAVSGAIVLELAVIQIAPWVSSYRVVLSAGTFARLLVLLFIPGFWSIGRLLAQSGTEFYPTHRLAVRRTIWVMLALVMLSVTGVAAWDLLLKSPWEQYQARQREEQAKKHAEEARARLFAELKPVKLANCEFKRFGEAHDGGYLLCANLLGGVQSAYSYGISGYDQWGCDVSTQLAVSVHEYDCFNLDRPTCPTGRPVFHGECVAGTQATIEKRFFDTPENQFLKNGDAGKQVVVKMDVEGAEWETLEKASDAVLQRIDQLTIEMHGVNEPERFTAVVSKLKQFFYVASLHMNNFACLQGVAPFPAEVYEVLFVSKRLAVPGEGPGGAPAALLASNNPTWSDCQKLTDLPPVHPPGQ